MPDNNNNPLLNAALRYAELGYPVFPCVPNAKNPLTPHGLKEATTDEMQIMLWWDAHPTANIGLSTEGLLVVDRDTDKVTGAKNPWLIDDPRLLDLFSGPWTETPRGGDHAWFRAPLGTDFRINASKIAPGIDIRANGGYVLVPPSQVDGNPYTWHNELDLPPDKLDLPPGWLLDILKQTEKKPAVKHDAGPIQEGSRNDSLARYAGYLRRGGSDESEILAALIERNKKCVPPLPESEVRKIAESVTRYESDQIESLIIEGTEPQPASKDPGPFPAKLLEVPGLVREIIAYTLRGAIRQQPELALANALALCGAIMGRKIEGETRLRTNIYCLGLCETGGGKDRSLQVAKKLLMLAGMRGLLPCEDLASATALVNSLKNNPTALIQIDEIGRFLQSTKDIAANPHLYEVNTVLLKLFSSANTLYFGKRYADSKRETSINQPHVCLYGTSVKQSVLNSLTSENLTDGFVSRLLVFEATDNNPERKRDAVFDDPAESLIKQIQWWGEYQPGGNLSDLNPQPRMLVDGPGVAELFWDAEDYYRHQQDLGEPGGALWTRATEHARKLALIWQCSADHEACELTREACEWALELVLHLTHKMIYWAMDCISDSKIGSDKNRIVRRLKERGPQSLSQLLRFMQHLRSRDLQDLLSDLILGGRIKQSGNAATGGRPRTDFEAI